MKIYDVIALTPPETDPRHWGRILREVHGQDHEYPDTEPARLSWLKRLAQDPVWGEATVITDRSEFPFWRLAPPKVRVEDEGGKSLGKPQRTTDLTEWALGVMYKTASKGAIKRWMKTVAASQDAGKVGKILHTYFLAQSNERDLYETDGKYELVTPESFSEIREKILSEIRLGTLPYWAWDSETDETNEEDSDAPNPWSAKLVDISVAITPGHAWRFPIAHQGDENLELGEILDLLLSCYSETKYAHKHVLLHNCKYDYSVLANPIQNFPVHIIYEHWLPLTVDTLLAAQVANMRPAGMKPLARTHLGVKTIDFKKLTEGKPFSELPSEPANIYAGQDADWLLRLWPLISERLDSLSVRHVFERKMKVVEFFMRCERRGLKSNVPKLQALHDHSISERARAYAGLLQAFRDAGVAVPDDFNPGSSPQLTRALFAPRAAGGLGLPVLVRTKTGNPSAGAKARTKLKIEGISHPVLAWLNLWSEHEQRITAFTTPMLTKFIQSDGRIHPSFGIASTETQRTSCQQPNSQQFDEELASCFEPETDEETGKQGEVADIDYSQVELRVLAVEFNEPKMLETYNQPRYLPDGTENPEADIHSRTQKETGAKTRRFAKNLNFGKAFRGGVETLSITTGVPMDQVAPFSKKFDESYSELTRNLKLRTKEAEAEGLVRTWDGWVRLLPPAVTESQKAANMRLVANTPVQGGAAGIIFLAIERILPLLRAAEEFDIHPFNMVHDALYFECGPDTDPSYWRSFLGKVVRIMEGANPWPDQLPLYADLKVGKNWGDDLHVPDYTDTEDEAA